MSKLQTKRCCSQVSFVLFYANYFFVIYEGNHSRQSRFSTFPQVLVIHAKKFQLVNWVPTKIGQLNTERQKKTKQLVLIRYLNQMFPLFYLKTMNLYLTLTQAKDSSLERLSFQMRQQVSNINYCKLRTIHIINVSKEPDRLIFNETAIAQLTAMGFPEIRCQKALLATGNSDPESAMEWLFAHMDDPGQILI